MVAGEVFGAHGGANLVAPLCGLAGTSLGILGTLLLPSGRLPGNGNNGNNPVYAPAQVSPGQPPGAVPGASGLPQPSTNTRSS